MKQAEDEIKALIKAAEDSNEMRRRYREETYAIRKNRFDEK